MKTRCCLLSIGLATGFCAAAQGAILTFEDVPVPQNNDFNVILGWYGGVTFHWAAVAADHLVARSNHASDFWSSDGTGPFLQPHSGYIAVFNPVGADFDFATEQILTGVWVARPNLGPTGVGGAEELTLTAYGGDTTLAKLAIHLTSTTPVFWDTSALLHLSGITRYTISPAVPGLETGYFVADDFHFASNSLAELCPCDGRWQGHAEYVRCVHGAIVSLVKEDALTREQARNLLHDAIRSDCGRKPPGSR